MPGLPDNHDEQCPSRLFQNGGFVHSSSTTFRPMSQFCLFLPVHIGYRAPGQTGFTINSSTPKRKATLTKPTTSINSDSFAIFCFIRWSVFEATIRKNGPILSIQFQSRASMTTDQSVWRSMSGKSQSNQKTFKVSTFHVFSFKISFFDNFRSQCRVSSWCVWRRTVNFTISQSWFSLIGLTLRVEL